VLQPELRLLCALSVRMVSVVDSMSSTMPTSPGSRYLVQTLSRWKRCNLRSIDAKRPCCREIHPVIRYAFGALITTVKTFCFCRGSGWSIRYEKCGHPAYQCCWIEQTPTLDLQMSLKLLQDSRYLPQTARLSPLDADSYRTSGNSDSLNESSSITYRAMHS